MAYTGWLGESVLPFVRRSFRISPGREEIGLAGASMGGLISLHAFFRSPELYGVCGAMSPSLFFAREALTRWVGRQPFAGGRIYLDIGTLEGRRFKWRRCAAALSVGRDAATAQAPQGAREEGLPARASISSGSRSRAAATTKRRGRGGFPACSGFSFRPTAGA